MGRLRKKNNTNIGRQNKYYVKNDKENETVVNEPNEMEGEGMFNKIRALRDAEAAELKTLDQTTINNVQSYINDMNNTIEEVKEFEDDRYEYVGAVYSLNELTKLTVVEVLKRGKVPYVWVVDRNLFMYYINGIWSDDKTVKDWVVVYKDDDLALKSFDGEVRMLLFKDIEDINMDNRKIANILSTVSGLNVEVIENVIDCVENGWEAEAIYNLNDGEISNQMSLQDVERVVEDYNYWINLGFNRVQVNYDMQVEDDDENVELVEFVTNEHEGLDVDNVAPLLQKMDMAEIYNEVVQERNQPAGVDMDSEMVFFDIDEEIPFNAEGEMFDIEYNGLGNWDVNNVENEFEMFSDDASLKSLDLSIFDDEIMFDDDEILPDDEIMFDDDEILPDDEIMFDDDLEFEDEMEFDDYLNEEDIVFEDNLNEDDEVVQENVAPPFTTGVVTDVYNSGYLVVTTREGTTIPSVFGKISDETLVDENGNYANVPELVMDDNLGMENVVFEDQDLLAILKVRISALLDMQNDEGEFVFKDDKCLNMVLEKLTEAQMWLDLWTKLN